MSLYKFFLGRVKILLDYIGLKRTYLQFLWSYLVISDENMYSNKRIWTTMKNTGISKISIASSAIVSFTGG